MDSPPGKTNGGFEVTVDDEIQSDNDPGSPRETKSSGTTNVTSSRTKRNSSANTKRSSSCSSSKTDCRNSGLEAVWSTDVPVHALPVRWNAAMVSTEEESKPGNGKCITICAVVLLVLLLVGCGIAAAVYILSKSMS